MKKYTSVIFDLDGTLLDTSEGVIKSLDYTIEKLSLEPLNLNEKLNFIGPPITKSLKEKYNLTEKQSINATKIFRDRYKEHDCLLCKIYTNIIELLKMLKERNILIGVATYKREDYAKKILENVGISRYFNVIKGADYDGKLTKIDILNNCLKELGEQNYSNSILIGDTEYDAISAQSLGVDFIGVTYGYGFKEKNIINSYKNIGAFENVKEIIEMIDTILN